MASHFKATHMSFLHSMLGVSLLDKIRNVEILRRYNVLSIANTISRQSMQWLSHLAHMEPNRLPKHIFSGQIS